MPSKRNKEFSHHSLVKKKQYLKIPLLKRDFRHNMHIMSGGWSPQFWRSSARSKKCCDDNKQMPVTYVDTDSDSACENRPENMNCSGTTLQHSDTNSSNFERLVSFVDTCKSSISPDMSLQDYDAEISEHESTSDDYVIFPDSNSDQSEIVTGTRRKVSMSTVSTITTVNKKYNIEARRPLHNEIASSSGNNILGSPGKIFYGKKNLPQASRTSSRQKVAPYTTEKMSSTEFDDDDSIKFIRMIEAPQTSKSPLKSISKTPQKTTETSPGGKYHQHPLLSAHRKKSSSLQVSKNVSRQTVSPITSPVKHNKETQLEHKVPQTRKSPILSHSSPIKCKERVTPPSGDSSKSQINNGHHSDTVENNEDNSTDDDIILVQTDQVENEEIDNATLKRVVISVVGHYLEENPDNEVTMQFILQRLKALYHRDFTERSNYIEIYIRRALQRCHSAQKLRRVVRPGVRQSDIITLSSENWVNDVIIDQYMNILVENSTEYGAISSFWYEELSRGTEPVLPSGWAKMQYILAPTCIDSHWSLLCYLPISNCVEIYSSLSVCEVEVQCSERLLNFFHEKSQAKNEGHCYTPSGLPHQQNEYDCGVYICMFARCIIYKNSFKITPRQVCEFRRWLKNEIVQAKLFTGREEINCNDSGSDSEIEVGRDDNNVEYLD